MNDEELKQVITAKYGNKFGGEFYNNLNDLQANLDLDDGHFELVGTWDEFGITLAELTDNLMWNCIVVIRTPVSGNSIEAQSDITADDICSNVTSFKSEHSDDYSDAWNSVEGLPALLNNQIIKELLTGYQSDITAEQIQAVTNMVNNTTLNPWDAIPMYVILKSKNQI